MHAHVNIALRAARAAAETIVQGWDRLDRVRIVDANPDTYLTSMDQDGDKTILFHLQKAFPRHRFHSRVSGDSGDPSSNTLWLIDPLLGNRNYLRGIPHFGISIACQVDGVLSQAVVLQPLLGEEYSASRGAGAQLNARRLRVSDASDLADTLIGIDCTGLPQAGFLSLQEQLLGAGAEPRINGCAALDLVQVAAGRLQGGWCAAGAASSRAGAVLLLTEAGGLIGSESGDPALDGARELLFGGPRLFRELVKLRRKLT